MFLDELQAEFDSIVYDNSQSQEEFRKQIKEIENEVSKKYMELSKIENSAERQLRFVELKENEREKKAALKSLRIRSGKNAADKKRELEMLQNKLASMIFLDTACGSGNFLTETYMSLKNYRVMVRLQCLKLQIQSRFLFNHSMGLKSTILRFQLQELQCG